MSEPIHRPAPIPGSFSLAGEDPWSRLQRALRLAPRQGLGVARRAVILAALTWLPVVAWAIFTSASRSPRAGETLLGHFSVHVLCLVVIPLLVLGEAVAEGIFRRILPQFVASGVVPAGARGRFAGVVHEVGRLRDAWPAWAFIGGLPVILAVLGAGRAGEVDPLRWAIAADGVSLGFGGWWFILVARPLSLLLLLAWLWRLAIVVVLFRRIAFSGLQLIPAHPDRAGGLGFVEQTTFAFSPVVLAISSLVAAPAAHELLYHDLSLAALKVPAAALLVILLAAFLAPLSIFFGVLKATKVRATLEYGALVARMGGHVHRRWILGEPASNDPLLDAPEIGPLTDAAAIYEATARMRPFPIGRMGLLAVVVPAVAPMLAVVALKIPLREVLLRLAGALL
jgi:hypothetical protein